MNKRLIMSTFLISLVLLVSGCVYSNSQNSCIDPKVNLQYEKNIYFNGDSHKQIPVKLTIMNENKEQLKITTIGIDPNLWFTPDASNSCPEENKNCYFYREVNEYINQYETKEIPLILYASNVAFSDANNSKSKENTIILDVQVSSFILPNVGCNSVEAKDFITFHA